METRANYIVIGLFTLLAIIAGLGFFVWLARFQVDRQYDYYDVLFRDVSGLTRAAEVRYNGLNVGQVVELEMYSDNSSLVRVHIEVTAGTPIKTDTKAQLDVLGVTGVSYVSLSGGGQDAPLLEPPESGGWPMIIAQRSVFEQLTADAPDVFTEALQLLRNLQAFAGPENQEHVTNTLRNIDAASSRLGEALDDFSAISGTIAEATDEITVFTSRLQPVADAVQQTLANADTALISATSAFDQAGTTLASADDAIGDLSGSIDGIEVLVREEVPQTVAELQGTISNVELDARETLTEFTAAARSATARLDQLETTIAGFEGMMSNANDTFESMEMASVSIGELVEGEGTLLVEDLRRVLVNVDEALVTVNSVVADDLPVVVADVRGAVASARQVIEQVGADVTSFTGEIRPLAGTADEALVAATDVFRRANFTLEGVDSALAAAESTLEAAEVTFGAAAVVIDRDVQPTAAEIRVAAERLGVAVEQVADDIPAATAELRAMLERADSVVEQIGSAVGAAAPAVQDFANSGLPEYSKLGREARELIVHLERIANRLERDPARFLLGGQAPEYQR